MKSQQVLAFALVATATLSGCAANGFEKYYTPTASAEKILAAPITIPAPATPKLLQHSANVQADAKQQAEHGYICIGTSSFYGPANKTTQKQALEQAKKVHAAVVLVASSYKDTLNGSVPLTLQNPNVVTTVSTTGTVNSYGSNGYGSGTYNANSTITSPGGSTTYQLPYSVSRNNYFASYWVKQDTSKMRLGVRYGPLNDAQRTALQRNTGVNVAIVVAGTPAFSANILEGDIVLAINGEDVIDQLGFDAQLTRFAGQPVELQVMRGNKPLKILLTLNGGPVHAG